MADHDVNDFAHGLSAKLASRSRHVCLFLGAGASRAAGLPDVSTLQATVLSQLDAKARGRFETQLDTRTLEQALSRVRRIEALVEGAAEIDGLTKAAAAELDVAVCREIVAALDSDKADLEPALKLAAWAARAEYQLPVEIFTVNYDLVLEAAFEALGVPYFDGFVGSLGARFRTDFVEAAPGDEDSWLPSFLVRLWKLHGSVNWRWEGAEHRHVLRLGQPVEPDALAAIYPSDAKYEESRRVPFIVLQDRFRRALHHPETLVLLSGYSFGDEHLNEILFEAAQRRPRTEFVAFCYGQPSDDLMERAQRTPNLQVTGPSEAVLSGRRAAWKVPDDAPEDLWCDDAFALGDFGSLAAFLARSSPPEGELEQRLAQLLAPAVGGSGA
jgi:hypothetical protein